VHGRSEAHHHFDASLADSIDDFLPLGCVGDLEFLLEKDGRLLVGGLDDAGDEVRVRGGGCGRQEMKEVDRLSEKKH
jgi:hypothetical protein